MDSIYKWDREDKLYAIEALHHSDQPDRNQYLLQLIVDDDPVVRGKTALAMEDLDDDTLMEAVGALLDQDETEYRILACELLGSTENADYSETLKPLLEADDDRVVRSAIAVLDNLPKQRGLQLLDSVIKTYKAEWSKAVKRLLNRWHPTEVFPRIKSLYPVVDPEFRTQLLRLAAVSGHPDVEDWVLSTLEDLEPSDAKKTVVRWLL
ncbi:MAG: HEAT repeat domain-containing protein [bacterium]